MTFENGPFVVCFGNGLAAEIKADTCKETEDGWLEFYEGDKLVDRLNRCQVAILRDTTMPKTSEKFDLATSEN